MNAKQYIILFVCLLSLFAFVCTTHWGQCHLPWWINKAAYKCHLTTWNPYCMAWDIIWMAEDYDKWENE